MYKNYIIILIFLLMGFEQFAQPRLKISPDIVNFKSIYDRYETTLLINDGNQILRIDSLNVQKAFYLFDFEYGQQLPININPGDTVKLNITLVNFYNITVADTSDSILVYSNSDINPNTLRIKIDFYDSGYGTCAGKVTDNLLSPMENSKIYFFYWGIYLFDSTYTDVNGDYSALLPKGSYTVGAFKEGYRTVFSGNTTDPFYSEPVNIDSGGTANINLILPKLATTLYSISGSLYSPSFDAISNGIVVIRKGTHTPTAMKADTTQMTSVYAGFVDQGGNYNINVDESGYYFVQGYANNFLPTYYNNKDLPSLFWQTADSVLITSSQINKNLYLVRDSAYGAGKVYGKISLSPSGSTDFEGITLLAKSVSNESYYTYNFGKADGSYYITNLPYGPYQIVAQKIGYDNAVSDIFTIDSNNTTYYNVNIQMNLTGIKNETPIPNDLILSPNYPNPFNPITNISFSLPKTELVSLTIYNTLGEKIAVLINDIISAGPHLVSFDASGLASGIYYYRIQTGSFSQTRKMVLMK